MPGGCGCCLFIVGVRICILGLIVFVCFWYWTLCIRVAGYLYIGVNGFDCEFEAAFFLGELKMVDLIK